ncbi:MAG: hypothetical protein EGR21_10345 [Faecalibacterium prausnitzii]|nr:hypothetical protein [Faecalibacterium prausnitzii]MBD9004796.1 hypothetical protein [Faecalibacterium prausnitzii]
MKKWLIGCLTVLAMVCLIPGIVLKAAAETVPVRCPFCGISEEREVRRYEKYDSTYHKVCVDACQNCHKDGNVAYIQVHTGGTGTFTCTKGKTCEKCGAEYGILGHDWGAWTPNYDGTNTHTRRCKRSNCDAEETGSCSGGYAACDSLGMCETCGGSYYGGHSWGEWSSAGNGTHTRSCTNYCSEVDTASCFGGTATCSAKAVCKVCGGEYGEKDPNNHDLVQHAAKAPTCTEKGWNAYETCSRCDYTTYAELPALNHDYQAVTVEPTCETDGYTVFTCSRCKDSYTADPTDKLGHQFGAWSPNGTGAQSADCLRQGCAHTGSTDCRKFTFRTAEGEALTFCPVCGQAENAAQLEKIEAATAWANSGSLSAEDVTARTNGEYLSVAFETAGSLTQPTGLVRLALPAGLLEGKTLVCIAPDGTQTEMPFETERGTIILTLDFANSALPVMLFRLVPQTAAL